MKKGSILTIMALSMLGACDFATVDSTEHCVETRYGKVVTESMGTGLNFLGFNEATCFNMTEQTWPANNEKEVVSGQTKDPMTVNFDVSVLWSYDPSTINETFREKRTSDAVELELINSIREGVRNTISTWTIDQLLANRTTLGDSMKVQIQRKIGNRARIHTVFVRGMGYPEAIEKQQVAKIEAERKQQTALAQFKADSVTAFNKQYQAQVEANIREMNAKVYDSNPSLLRLEIEKVRTEGMRGICGQSTTCIIGGNVADKWMAVGTGGK